MDEGVAAASGDSTDGSGATADSDGDASLLPTFLGGLVGVGIIFGGVVLYRRRTVVLEGHGVLLLSEAEEVRTKGERGGLPEHDGWQQIPYSVGRELHSKPQEGWVARTTRDDPVGLDDHESDVTFEGYPQEWREAKKRGLDLSTRFGFWINEEGMLRVGSPTDPHVFDPARGKAEAAPASTPKDDGPINLDSLYGDDGIPPA